MLNLTLNHKFKKVSYSFWIYTRTLCFILCYFTSLQRCFSPTLLSRRLVAGGLWRSVFLVREKVRYIFLVCIPLH